MVTAVPVYIEDGKNQYSEVPARTPGGDIMAGPVYHGIEVKNQYAPPPKKVDGPIVMAGPIYKGVENTHQCRELPAKGETVTPVNHPILPANYQHKYNPFEPKKEVCGLSKNNLNLILFSHF